MNIDLAISLGHNSSCVAIDFKIGRILCGFEEERLTGVKSDSSYPILSIDRCMKVLGKPNIRNVYISHWFADGRLVKCKYYDEGHMKLLNADNIIPVSKDFTHHDAHNYSAIAFAQSEPGFNENFHSIVIDGFGTHGECVSIYESTKRTAYYTRTRLLHRAFGYNKSLGMLYQYATAFLGLKMQQDEYKLLGYEAHAKDFDLEALEMIAEYAHEISSEYFSGIMNPMAIDRDQDPIVNINALKKAKDGIFEKLWRILNEFDISDRTTHESRIIVAMLVQKVLENVITSLVTTYGIKKLICSGGVFMNVKLNMKLAFVVEKICIMPLAGDQGAPLGLYHYHNKNLEWPDHLYWGTRNWEGIEQADEVPGITVFTDRDAFVNAITAEINTVGWVNIVHGDMEYGPRALCNTSTLAVPTKEATKEINRLNDRSNIMPMAPVMTQEMADKYLNPMQHLFHKSLEYMISAVLLKEDVDTMDGAAHQYTADWFCYDFKTCRPQIIGANHLVFDVLEKLEHPLINTSFNYHGIPIVYSVKDIIESHRKQNENGPINTLIYVGEKS